MTKTCFQDVFLPSCFIILVFLQLLPTGIHGNGQGSKPTIRVRDDKDEGVQAECTSEGWDTQPEVEWRDLRGDTIPSLTNLSVSPTTGRFAVTSRVVVNDRTIEGFSCSIVDPLLNVTLTTSHLLAPFSRRPWPMVWIICLPLIFMALGFVAAGAICILWKKQKDKLRESKEKYQQQANDDKGSPFLDPETANPKLELSEDLKSVYRLLFAQDLPDTPEKFDKDPCVLGQKRFTEGKHYWEVEVGERTAWNLGVCLDSLDRKGRIPKSPEHGVWAVEFYKEKLWALTFPRVCLSLSQPLHRVGIFLDCEARNISFYNGTDGSLIYTFSEVFFSGPLRPFFCLWVLDRRPLTVYRSLSSTEFH